MIVPSVSELPALSVTVLGCGSSGGVPRVGFGFGACNPDQPKNTRLRCSVLIKQVSAHGVTQVMIDVSPDVRAQLLREQVTYLDGILLTHEHADHTHGMDDLRPLSQCQRSLVPVYMNAVTASEVRHKFDYCFETPPGSSYPPIVRHIDLSPDADVVIDGAGGAITFTPLLVNHGDIDALGFRFGNVAYFPDVKAISSSVMDRLCGLDVLILDALRDVPHDTHLTVAESLDVISELQPQRAFLTNLHIDLDYDALCARLPESVRPCYDGLVIEVSGV